MKIAILGAGGKTGQQLVKQALAAGHKVTALLRTPSKLPITHNGLRVLAGDVEDFTAVERALQGNEAALTAYGPVPGGSKTVMQNGAKNIIQAMKKYGIRRLIYLTGAGVIQPEDPPALAPRIIIPLMKLISGDVLRDSEAGVRIIQASDVDYTIVRVPRLGDIPARGSYRTGYINPGFTPVSREDVAAFMLKELVEGRYIRKAPMIAY